MKYWFLIRHVRYYRLRRKLRQLHEKQERAGIARRLLNSDHELLDAIWRGTL